MILPALSVLLWCLKLFILLISSRKRGRQLCEVYSVSVDFTVISDQCVKLTLLQWHHSCTLAAFLPDRNEETRKYLIVYSCMTQPYKHLPVIVSYEIAINCDPLIHSTEKLLSSNNNKRHCLRGCFCFTLVCRYVFKNRTNYICILPIKICFSFSRLIALCDDFELTLIYVCVLCRVLEKKVCTYWGDSTK